MEKLVQDLFIVLDALIRDHRELVSCEQSKIECIVRQDWRKLGEALKRSEALLKSIETAENKRRRIIGKLGHGTAASMTVLTGEFDRPQAERLVQCTERLKSIIGELGRINERIHSLLTSSLEVIDFTLSLFQGEGPGSRTYCVNGAERKGGERCA